MGKVDGSEFSGMIEAAAALPKQHGQSWWEEGEDQRAELFKKIDDNGDGAISFDEWLAFVINKYKGLVSGLPALGDEDRKNMFAAMDENGDGAISFNEWLDFSMKTIVAQIQ